MTTVTPIKITAISNLHVGAGEQNFGVVDNLVQRDPVSEIPTINSSSLKGAIREHFISILRYKEDSKRVKTIFGHSDKDSANAGEVKFLPAHLLALPVRSNKQLYFLATTPDILKEYINSYKTLAKKEINITIPDIEDNQVYISTADNQCWVEDYEANNSKAQELNEISTKLFNGEPIALMNTNLFKTISLPIITRNKIAKDENDDNNLFYEEVVPRQSIFYTFIITPNKTDIEDEEVKKIFDTFLDDIEKELIQIGANASIGYGLCKFQKGA